MAAARLLAAVAAAASASAAAAASAGASAGVAQPSRLSWYVVSDTHLGHDVPNNVTGGVTTSLELNTQAVQMLNNISNGTLWPDSLGGGPVLPPVGVVISGDLVDNGGAAPGQWANWTSLYGLTGGDGLLRWPVYEGRGNHDAGNSTDNSYAHFVASEIVARNQLRRLMPGFNITNASATGLHYSWRWEASPGCALHVFMLNLYAGHVCAGCSPAPACFYGPVCHASWTYPEDSLGFLQATLPQVVGDSGDAVMLVTHYGFDPYSNDWYSAGERQELYATLTRYNTVALWVGHTHAASIYKLNSTGDAVYPPFPQPSPGAPPLLDVFNTPSTQYEDATGAPLPPQFMVAEAAVDPLTGNATLRVGQRVGLSWGEVLGSKTFSCPGKPLAAQQARGA